MISISSSRAPQYTWLALLAACGAIGWVTGVAPAVLVGACAALALPALAAFLPRYWRSESQALQTLGWTLVAIAAVALSGGIGSPLTILLVLGPLSGLALGRRQMAMEAAAFAAIGLFSLWLLSLWIEPPQLLGAPGMFIAALTLAAVVYVGMLCAAAIVHQRRRATQEAEMRLRPSETGRSLALRSGVQLPAALPFAVVAVSDLGRVRAIEGNHALTGTIQIGDIADEALAALDPSLGTGFSMLDNRAVIAHPEQGPLEVSSHGVEAGRAIVFSRAGDGDTEALKAEHARALTDRTTFFASLGHDLKTPLNAIIGFSDMMRSGIRGELSPAHADYADIIHESGEDLLLLVEDMLDLAKADARRLRLEFEPVDLAASGASVMRQLSAQATRAGVKLLQEGATEGWAEADPRAVRQIWQNLVSNAIKYSRKDDTVRMAVEANDEAVRLIVEDEGAGMSADDLERVSSPFAQGRNASGRAGTGLGLAVVKQFADLHGGRVQIDTAEGAGTRVVVTFRPAGPETDADFEKAAQ